MHEEITIANLKGIDALMSILVKEDKPCTQFLRYGTESHRNNLSCLVVPEWLSLNHWTGLVILEGWTVSRICASKYKVQWPEEKLLRCGLHNILFGIQVNS